MLAIAVVTTGQPAAWASQPGAGRPEVSDLAAADHRVRSAERGARFLAPEDCRPFESPRAYPVVADEAQVRQKAVLAAARSLARALHEVLWRNGTFDPAEASYGENPAAGGDILAFEWSLAEFLRMQRGEYRYLLDAANRLVATPTGFARQRAIVDLMDRMVSFKKANRRFLVVQGKLPVRGELAVMVSRLEASLDHMHLRVTEIQKMLVKAM